MFGRKKKKQQYSDGITIIAEGVKLDGIVTVKGNLRIDGELRGFLSVEGKAIVGKSGKVVGLIDADELLVEGSVEGEIVVRALLTIVSGGLLKGRCFLYNLHVEPEGILMGHCFMGPEIREKLAHFDRIATSNQIAINLPSYEQFVSPLLEPFSIQSDVVM
jgi:cytoskeletal protein CcmA (bactofilin family)